MSKNKFVKRCKGLPLLLAMLCLPQLASASVSQVRQQVLVIVSGTDSVAFALTDNPVISFEDNNLVVKSLDDSLIVSLADARYFLDERTSTDRVTTGINSLTLPGISKEQPQWAFGNGMVSGLHAGDIVRVFHVNGTLVKTIKADAQGQATLELSQLPNGVYIIRTRNSSIKIMNR